MSKNAEAPGLTGIRRQAAGDHRRLLRAVRTKFLRQRAILATYATMGVAISANPAYFPPASYPVPMTSIRIATRFTAIIATLLLANCANQKPAQFSADGKPINPYPAGTYDHFKAEPAYPKTFDVWKDEDLLAKTDPENSSIVVNLKTQRATLMNGEAVAMDYPICSGIPSRPTPPGTYYITEKIVDKRSNKYGTMLDANGDTETSNAEMGRDPVPEGGSFRGASMRYWMRLTNDGIGHHIGPLPSSRRPASHACIRGPSKTMPVVYSKVKPGTRFTIISGSEVEPGSLTQL